MSGISQATSTSAIPLPSAPATRGRPGPEETKKKQLAPPRLVPTDTFKPNEAVVPPASETNIRGQMHRTRQKDTIIDGMMAQDGCATKEQRQDIRDSLSVVNTDTLRFAAQNGVRIQVVNPGDSLIDTGVIKPQDAGEFQRNIPEYAEAGNQVLSEVNPQYQDRIKAAEAADRRQLEEMQRRSQGTGAKPSGGIGVQGEQEKVEGFNYDMAQHERRKKVAEQLKEKTDGKVMLYEPTVMLAGGNGPASDKPKNRAEAEAIYMMTRMPASTSQMAMTHGARTPEEVGQFNRMVEQLNGDRLTDARQEMIQFLEKGMNAPGADKKSMEQAIARFKEHPEETPVDHFDHDILVPNLFHYRPDDNPMNPNNAPKSEPTTVNLHDFKTLKDWQAHDGKVYSRDEARQRGYSGSMSGQYLDKQKLIIIRGEDYSIKDKNIPVHEFGHSVDFLLKEKNPEFHSKWRQDVSAAYQSSARKPQMWISRYSRTSEGEYIAEGFACRHYGGKILNTMDPALYSIITQMDQAAQAEGRKAN